MSFTSNIPDGTIVIDDNTPASATPEGMSKGYSERPMELYPQGFYRPVLGDSWLIPREEWYDRAVELERTKTRTKDIIERQGWEVKDQNGTNYCWCFGVVSACEIVRMLQGQSYVQLSAASAAAKVKSFRNVGGWGDQAADYIAKHGVVSEELWPEPKIDRRYDTTEAWQDAKRYFIEEWEELKGRDLDQMFSCLLRRWPVPGGYNHWSHLICNTDVAVFDKPRDTSDREMLRCFGTWFANSWKKTWGENGWGVLRNSKMLADGQIVIRSMRVGE